MNGFDDVTTRGLRTKPTRRDLIKLAAAAGAGTGLAAMASPLAAVAGPSALQEEPTVGGTLRVGVAAELAVLDPHITTLAAYHTTMRYTVFETLIEVDENSDYIPNLAESWTFAEDGMSLTLDLARDVKFHNGKDFTAEDVVFTINRVKDPSLASQFAPQLATVESAEAVDDHVVVLHFTAPTPAMLDNLLYVQIVTEEGIDSIDEHPVGTGPFEFVEWALHDHITVRRFADYRQEGLPYLDEIVFRPVLDGDTRLVNLQAGSLDLIEQPAPRDAERIEADPDLQLIATPPTSKYDNFQINTQHELMQDPRVRQALSFAFDRESYVRDILYGFGEPAVGPFSTINWGYDPLVEPFLAYDLERSRELLAEAGHEDGQGLDGLEILTPLGYPELQQAAVLLQASLATLGITASVRELEIAAWIDRIATEPDFVVTTDTYGYGGAGDPSGAFNTDNLHPDTNIHQFWTEEYAELVQQGATTQDQEEREEIYARLQQILMDEMPGFLIAHRSDLFASRTNVSGFNPGPLIRHHYTRTWLA